MKIENQNQSDDKIKTRIIKIRAIWRHIVLTVSLKKLTVRVCRQGRAPETTMQTDSTSARQFSSESGPVMVERFTPERLKLLRELEASLRGSRQALLALDLAGIEQGTREQVGLVRELQRFPEPWMKMPGPGARLEQRSEGRENETRGTGTSERPAWSREMAAEVRRSEEAVLQAARVQAALLARAQRKLRILANMLAGPTLNYGRLFAKAGGPASIAYSMRDGEI